MSIDEPRDPKSEVPQEATESGSQQPLSEGMPGPAKQAPNRKWWLAIPAVVVVAVIGVAAVGAAVPAESEDKEIRATQSADLDLGEVTVRELSDSLAEHGLALEIYPEFDEGSLGIESDPGTEADGDTQDNDDFEDSEDFGEEGDNLEEQEPAASFKVSGDELDATGVEPKQAAVATAIWTRFAQLIPAEQRGMVSGFELMPDGYEGAHVYPSEQDPTKWVLGVSNDLGDDLDEVLVHEFGHLLTLNKSQVPPGDLNSEQSVAQAEGSCKTYFTGEGCALPASTFARFVDQFWSEELLNELADIEAIADEDAYYSAMEKFYDAHQSDFVTEYAMTNPGEDLAETFATFVTKDRPEGNTVADQKVNFLYSDQKMVALRDQIRESLS